MFFQQGVCSIREPDNRSGELSQHKPFDPLESGPGGPRKTYKPYYMLYKLFWSPHAGGLRPQKHHQTFGCLLSSMPDLCDHALTLRSERGARSIWAQNPSGLQPPNPGRLFPVAGNASHTPVHFFVAKAVGLLAAPFKWHDSTVKYNTSNRQFVLHSAPPPKFTFQETTYCI